MARDARWGNSILRKIITVAASASGLRWAGKIDDQIKFLLNLRDQYGDGELEFDADDDGLVNIEYIYQREETDKEIERRLASERRNEDLERRQYERLKEKYGS